MNTKKSNKGFYLFSFVFICGLFGLSCSRVPPTPQPSIEVAADKNQPPFFRDVTAEAGIHFIYRNGEEAKHYAMLEVIGGGLAAFDFDGDGRLDLFITGGGYYDGPDKQQIKGHPCKLYRNVSTADGIRFEDATAAMGLDKIDYYSHGAAAGDFDNDGWPDLLVTGWQRLALFHNEPVDRLDKSKGRKFVEATAQAGLPRGLWTTSAAWGDLDGDGYADLYICQYVDWSFQNHPPDCTHDGKTRDVC
ncbi:MAG: FG-GAP repeat domain-containing protein, partial [Gemmataceae bacterium]